MQTMDSNYLKYTNVKTIYSTELKLFMHIMHAIDYVNVRGNIFVMANIRFIAFFYWKKNFYPLQPMYLNYLKYIQFFLLKSFYIANLFKYNMLMFSTLLLLGMINTENDVMNICSYFTENYLRKLF